jgi:predicted Zn-ribbon and HTH transcriptional regulator
LSRNSPTCASSKTGRPLSEYDSKAEAQSAAKYANKNFQNSNVVPYKCSKCGFWHLSPAERQTDSKTCTICRGSDGKLKEAYATERDALRRAGLLRKEQGVKLSVYVCEHGNGWHLTKNI